MKKKIIAAVLVSGLAITTVASANWNGQRGYCDGSRMQMQAIANLDQATQAKIKQFHTDNQAIIKEMAMKRAEKRALMRGDNPDAKLVAQLTGEMFDLRTTIRLKAEEAGISQYVGPMNKGYNGMSGNGGYGKHHRRMMN
jgi:zinc resistance-associated protein